MESFFQRGFNSSGLNPLLGKSFTFFRLVLTALGQFPPGQLLPGQLRPTNSPQDNPPGQLPPRQSPPGQLPPVNCPPLDKSVK